MTYHLPKLLITHWLEEEERNWNEQLCLYKTTKNVGHRPIYNIYNMKHKTWKKQQMEDKANGLIWQVRRLT